MTQRRTNFAKQHLFGKGLPLGPGAYHFVKHFAFLKTKEKLQRQNPLGLATAVLKAEAEGRKRHGRRSYG
ncbi:unnamed protein product [Prunus armeniaca]